MRYGDAVRTSTSKFWFSTDLDPIEDSNRDPQRYFYGYWHEDFGGVVETRKARIGKKQDYWEPYRWSKSDGMAPMPEGDFEGRQRIAGILFEERSSHQFQGVVWFLRPLLLLR